METFSIASLPDDDMVVTLVRSAAGYSSRDAPEDGCSFLVIRKDVVYMSNYFDMYACSKMLTFFFRCGRWMTARC